jgi:hypothetical protein
MVSLNRSLLFHRSLVSAAFDGVVSGTGLLFAGYLFSVSGNLVVALWSFFLVQSSFVMIPTRFPARGRPSPSGEAAEIDSFQRSYRQANEALQRLAKAGGN